MLNESAFIYDSSFLTSTLIDCNKIKTIHNRGVLFGRDMVLVAWEKKGWGPGQNG